MATRRNTRRSDELGLLVKQIAAGQPAQGRLTRRVPRWNRVRPALGMLRTRRGMACMVLLTSAAWFGGRWFFTERAATSAEISTGRELFLHEWQPGSPDNPSADKLVAEGGDGLGPVFNARSCVACHFQGGVGGAGDNRHNVSTFAVVATKARPTFHSGVIHAAAVTPSAFETPAEVSQRFPIVQGERRVISGCVVTLPAFNPVTFTSINTPALFGAGRIDRISEGTITSNRRLRQMGLLPRELSGDFHGTPPGRVRVLPNGRIGRFGWKAQFATLEEFVATACAVEMGLSNPKRRQDLPREHTEDRAARLDMTAQQLFELTSYTAGLPAPIRIVPTDGRRLTESVIGERLFTSIGCSDCHTPDLGEVAGIYSDLLLHKVEEADEAGGYGRVNPDVPLPESEAAPDEWKTPPLWAVADTAPYFHDGASPTLEAAILRHSAEARRVLERYRKLSDGERQAIVRFLETLKAPDVEAAPPAKIEKVATRR